MTAPLPREIAELAERWTLLATALGFSPPMTPEWALLLAVEVLRLRTDLAYAEHARATTEAALAHEQQTRAVAEAELADMAVLAKSIAHAGSVTDANTSVLIEAIEIAEAAGRRGLLTHHERNRLRALRRAVPS